MHPRRTNSLCACLAVALLAPGCSEEAAPAAPPTPGASSAPAQAAPPQPGATPASAAPSAPRPATPAAKPAAPVGTYRPDATGAQRMEIGGVVIVTTADLPARPDVEGSFSVATGNELTLKLRGWPITLRDGKVYVDFKDFGPAPQGSEIQLSPAGVKVGGELRGPLPQ